MDENGNINEESLNKLLKMADILDGTKKREIIILLLMLKKIQIFCYKANTKGEINK